MSPLLLLACAVGPPAADVEVAGAPAGRPFALLREELVKTWPRNRTVRFVFHGHSVPAGYFKTPRVRRFDSYPALFHRRLCDAYPTAVVDVCVTAVGGEHAEAGAARFERDVLAMNPDLVFLDYALNDRRLGLPRAEAAWRSMLDACRERGVPVARLHPHPGLLRRPAGRRRPAVPARPPDPPAGGGVRRPRHRLLRRLPRPRRRRRRPGRLPRPTQPPRPRGARGRRRTLNEAVRPVTRGEVQLFGEGDLHGGNSGRGRGAGDSTGRRPFTRSPPA